MANESVNMMRELQDRNIYLEDENAKLMMMLEEHKDNIELLITEIQSLKQKNDDLEVEASKYQAALGVATNFDYNDDQNLNVKLNEDILALQDTLDNYVTNLKPRIDVNINKAKELLRKYKCQTEISDKEPNKPLIKAVLQRHVLEEIFKQADLYFKRSDYQEYYLESDIVESTKNLTGLMEKLYYNRLGDDEITHLIPIRLRQQVYIALGTRGFNDIKESTSKYNKHNFIDVISKEINEMMNEFRDIKDIEKKKNVNALAESLVRDVVRIFYFCLPIQEPMAQYRWINNKEKINNISMKGSWDRDDIDDMIVEVCSFPMIFKKEDDGDKICTPAKVFPCRDIRSWSENLTDGMSNLKKMLKPDDYSALSLQVDENKFEQTNSANSHVSN